MYAAAAGRGQVAPPMGLFAKLSSSWLFVPLTLVYALLTRYAYVSVIAEDAYFSASGFYAYPPRQFTELIGFAFSLVPILWLRRTLVQASDLCVIYLYFFVYVPSCVLMPYSSLASVGQQLSFLAVLLIVFGLVEVRRLFLPMLLPQSGPDKAGIYGAAIVATALGSIGLLFYLGAVDFSQLSFFDVYERRAELLYNQSQASRIVFYLCNWLATAIAPLLLVYGLDRRKYAIAALGIIVALIALSATSFKSHFFVPLTVAAFYIAFRMAGQRALGLTVLGMVLFISILSLVWDGLFNDTPSVTWALEYRFIGNNGFLTAKYFDYFAHMPKGYFVDTFGRFFFDSPYNVPLAQAVGESFSALRGNHANANLWADGFANLGYFGLIFASLELVLFFWLLDSVAEGKNIWLITPTLVAVSFALANTAVHTMLTSNGGAILLMLLALLPRERPVSVQAAPRVAYQQ